MAVEYNNYVQDDTTTITATLDHKNFSGAEMESLNEALIIINEWKPASDVFALKNYVFGLSAINSCTAAYINAHYRKAVKLRSQAFIPTLIPVVFLPAIAGSVLHHHFVQRPLLLQKFQCPVCLELRGGAVQLFAGILYPLVLAPLASFQFATRLYTYALPSVFEPKALLKEVFRMTRPLLSKLYILAGLQVIVGTAWTHWEAHNIFTVMSKLSKMEEAVARHRKG
ncbi:uncharacterized protein [Procambarus clarkii]|uniref:uncharacterized protein isoform X1 n=2 Tax=Procambarus clarkii TaxID=6728 RepID=UPI003743819C